MNPQLTDWMAIFALVAASGTIKATAAAIWLRDTDPTSSTVATQRLRYGLLWLGTLMAMACTIHLHRTATLAELRTGAGQYLAIDSLTPQIIGVLNYGLIYGVWAATTLLAVICVYRRPAVMAFKLLLGRYRGGYITTQDFRAGRGNWMPMQPRIIERDGYPVRVFEPMA